MRKRLKRNINDSREMGGREETTDERRRGRGIEREKRNSRTAERKQEDLENKKKKCEEREK